MRTAVKVAGMVAVLGLAPGASAAGDVPPDGRPLRCESSDGKTRECSVDATGGARLLRQLSQAPCIEGRTWGRMRRSIWVTQGCRAVFLAFPADGRRGYGVNYGYGNGGRIGQSLKCASEDGRWKHCSADTRGGVDVVRQMSRNQCIRGQSWGIDRSGVWVNGGCRAEFRLGGRDDDESPVEPARFRCESDDGKPRSCGAVGRGGVRLIKQLSHADCVQGRSWGVARGAVWVDQGCRAEFEVTDGVSDGRW
ncbi:DUF3011 domain-containing protein [Cognatilysobacter lacus]|nr:DUF3011 domain-containing protein [Lysobacter lacus]